MSVCFCLLFILVLRHDGIESLDWIILSSTDPYLDRDSDNNNKDDNNNAVNCPDHGTEGEKTTKKRKQGLFWSLRPELQDAIIQSVIEDAPEQQKVLKKNW